MLTYVKGDATAPKGDGPKVIIHCVNDSGGWGAGFVLALSRRWSLPEAAYRQWHRMSSVPDRLFDEGKVFTTDGFKLGEVQFVKTALNLWVANIIGQHSFITSSDFDDDGPPIRYPAIESGLKKVRGFCGSRKASVHMPRMGSGLAGGDWARIEALVQAELVQHGVDVTVYDLK